MLTFPSSRNGAVLVVCLLILLAGIVVSHRMIGGEAEVALKFEAAALASYIAVLPLHLLARPATPVSSVIFSPERRSSNVLFCLLAQAAMTTLMAVSGPYTYLPMSPKLSLSWFCILCAIVMTSTAIFLALAFDQIVNMRSLFNIASGRVAHNSAMLISSSAVCVLRVALSYLHVPNGEAIEKTTLMWSLYIGLFLAAQAACISWIFAKCSWSPLVIGVLFSAWYTLSEILIRRNYWSFEMGGQVSYVPHTLGQFVVADSDLSLLGFAIVGIVYRTKKPRSHVGHAPRACQINHRDLFAGETG